MLIKLPADLERAIQDFIDKYYKRELIKDNKGKYLDIDNELKKIVKTLEKRNLYAFVKMMKDNIAYYPCYFAGGRQLLDIVKRMQKTGELKQYLNNKDAP